MASFTARDHPKDQAKRLNAVVDRVTATETDVEAVTARVTTAEGGLSSAQTSIGELQTGLDALTTVVGGKAATVHTHAVADITDLQTTLDGLAPLVHTHVVADVTGLQILLDAKAGLNSPALTGNPTAPTQSAGNNTTRLATTEFVTAALAAPLGVTAFSANRTISNSDHNRLLTFTAAAARDVTLDSTASAGCRCWIAHRGSGALNILCAAGLRKNGGAVTTGGGTLAIDGHALFIHEGAGIWLGDGPGLA